MATDSRQTVNIRIPHEQLARLDAICARTGATRSSAILDAIDRWIASREPGSTPPTAPPTR